MPPLIEWENLWYSGREGSRSLEKCRSLECMIKSGLNAKVCVLPVENKNQTLVQATFLIFHLKCSLFQFGVSSQLSTLCLSRPWESGKSHCAVALQTLPQQSRVINLIQIHICLYQVTVLRSIPEEKPPATCSTGEEWCAGQGRRWCLGGAP